MRPKRIQWRRTKGWKKPPDTVYVGRRSRWGNPFTVKEYGTRESAVMHFRMWLEGTTTLDSEGFLIADGEEGLKLAAAAREELRGKDLACWCPLDGEPCHADVLLEIANE